MWEENEDHEETAVEGFKSLEHHSSLPGSALQLNNNNFQTSKYTYAKRKCHYDNLILPLGSII